MILMGKNPTAVYSLVEVKPATQARELAHVESTTRPSPGHPCPATRQKEASGHEPD